MSLRRALRHLGQRAAGIRETLGEAGLVTIPAGARPPGGMVQIPPGFHPQSVRHRGQGLHYAPGWRGSGMQPIRATPMVAYTNRVTSVPLTGGQGQAKVAANTATVTIGPQGAGNVWYPAQAVVSTTTGTLDTSTCKLYLGAQGVPVLLVGTVFSGNGTIALALPPLSPGQYLIAIWTGATNGDVAAVNVVGTMDALSNLPIQQPGAA